MKRALTLTLLLAAPASLTAQLGAGAYVIDRYDGLQATIDVFSYEPGSWLCTTPNALCNITADSILLAGGTANFEPTGLQVNPPGNPPLTDFRLATTRQFNVARWYGWVSQYTPKGPLDQALQALSPEGEPVQTYDLEGSTWSLYLFEVPVVGRYVATEDSESGETYRQQKLVLRLQPTSARWVDDVQLKHGIEPIGDPSALVARVEVIHYNHCSRPEPPEQRTTEEERERVRDCPFDSAVPAISSLGAGQSVTMYLDAATAADPTSSGGFDCALNYESRLADGTAAQNGFCEMGFDQPVYVPITLTGAGTHNTGCGFLDVVTDCQRWGDAFTYTLLVHVLTEGKYQMLAPTPVASDLDLTQQSTLSQAPFRVLANWFLAAADWIGGIPSSLGRGIAAAVMGLLIPIALAFAVVMLLLLMLRVLGKSVMRGAVDILSGRRRG